MPKGGGVKMGETEIDFEGAEENGSDDSTELTGEDFLRGAFIKNPPVGESIILDVLAVKDNPNIKGKNNSTGKDFDIGLKDKNGKIKRVDIVTPEGTYTINSWGVYFQLFGRTGILMKYYKKNNTFKGAKVKLTHLADGQHSTMKIDMLSKVIGKTIPETEKYQQEIKLAMKENRLYKSELISE